MLETIYNTLSTIPLWVYTQLAFWGLMVIFLGVGAYCDERIRHLQHDDYDNFL